MNSHRPEYVYSCPCPHIFANELYRQVDNLCGLEGAFYDPRCEATSCLAVDMLLVSCRSHIAQIQAEGPAHASPQARYLLWSCLS